MGLDMYLQGHQYYSNRTETIDNFPVKEITVELGYWRKHPNLHGAIVQTFAEGVDDCEPIELNQGDIHTLIGMVKSGSLPATTGFFFGSSSNPGEEGYQEQVDEDIRLLENALKFYDHKSKNEYRWVTYRASW